LASSVDCSSQYQIVGHTFDFVDRRLLFISAMGSEGILRRKKENIQKWGTIRGKK
jgi:hypothetical protein